MKSPRFIFATLGIAISSSALLLAFTNCTQMKSAPGGTSQSSQGVPQTSTTSTTTVPTGPSATDYFPQGNLWTSDISDPIAHPKDSDSDAIIANLASLGGWGTGSFRIDTSIKVLTANAKTPKFPIVQNTNPDGDNLSPIPAPPDGSLEGETGYQCTGGGDCHLIVWDTSVNKLYETWSTNFDGTTFTAAFLGVWDLTKLYPAGRGDGCTSADAAGFPIAPLLFSADEIASGHLDHAVRFILPNNRWRDSAWVHPATHTGALRNGNTAGVFYGSRFRLKASVDISSFSAPAQVLATALKKYGMFAADGGNIALTAMGDTYTTHKWSEFPAVSDPRWAPLDVHSLQVTDFEIVNDGRTRGTGDDCVRNGL